MKKPTVRSPLTPSDIEVLLHFHVSPNPHPRQNAPAVVAAIAKFLTEGILKWESGSTTELRLPRESTLPVIYCTTERGKVFIEMLCNTPFPVPSWKDPRP